jgi:hypothetical protein
MLKKTVVFRHEKSIDHQWRECVKRYGFAPLFPDFSQKVAISCLYADWRGELHIPQHGGIGRLVLEKQQTARGRHQAAADDEKSYSCEAEKKFAKRFHELCLELVQLFDFRLKQAASQLQKE